MLKFNMGCGHNRREGFVNVDAAAASAADEVHDLEQFPWPWAADCADEVLFIHSLEHMGADPQVFIGVMRELYRICADGAAVVIHVPHPRHDSFINDPTHVRPITPEVLSLFDMARNDEWRALGKANSPLAHYTAVDFEITNVVQLLDKAVQDDMAAGKITMADVPALARTQLNAIAEYRLTLKVHKPPRGR